MNTDNASPGRTRVAGWSVILAVVIVNSAMDVVLMTTPAAEMLRAIARATRGLVLPPLVMCAVEFACIVVGVMFAAGRLRWSDVGLRRRDVLPGILCAVGLWAAVQLVAAGSELAGGTALALHAQWTQRPLYAVGRILADWLGVAVYEEVVFRGFLLTQFWLHFTAWLHGRRWLALPLAAVLSQAIFALGHLPYLLLHGGIESASLPAALLYLFGLGMMFAVVYLSTQSLPVAIAAHALFNAPALLFATPDALATTSIVVLVLALVVPLGLLRAAKARRRECRDEP